MLNKDHRFVVTSFGYLHAYVDNLISSAPACTHHTGSRYVKGDSLFGGIDFDSRRGSVNGPCSWLGQVKPGSKYLIEFQYINVGMY